MTSFASVRDVASRTAALAQAKESLIQANNEMAARGYAKPITSPSISAPYNKIVL
jgi:hypothetical protein